MNPSVDMKNSLNRYPKEIARALKIRPMEASYESAFLPVFTKVPVDERQLSKDDVTQASVVREWISGFVARGLLTLG